MSPEDISEIITTGKLLLEKMTISDSACLYIHSMLAAVINDNMNLDARLVSGSLTIKDKKIFDHTPIKQLLSSTQNIYLSWNGHAWIEVENMIFDFSLFQTIASNQTPIETKRVVKDVFGNVDYLVGQKERLCSMGVFYSEHEEISDNEMSVLVNTINELNLLQ